MANRKKKQARVPGMSRPKVRIPERIRAQLDATAIHESAHTVVSHAVGQHPVYARITPVYLPAGHPENPTSNPMVSLGYSSSEPAMADEVYQTYLAGLPFTPAQQDWLLRQIPVCLAGVIVETNSRSNAADPATAVSDLQQAAESAGYLGCVLKKGARPIREPGHHPVGGQSARPRFSRSAQTTFSRSRTLYSHTANFTKRN